MLKGKRLTIFIILVAFIILFNGCSNENYQSVNEKTGEKQNEESEQLELGNGKEGLQSHYNAEYLTKRLGKPHSVTFDNLGNMYVADSINLKKVSVNGDIEIFQSFDERCMTAMTDKDNNIFVATEHHLFKFTSKGDKTILADDFTRADGLEMDLSGNIYVSDAYENTIYRISPKGEKTIFIENDKKNTLPGTYYVTGLRFDSNYENLYVVRHEEDKIMIYPIKPDGSCGEGEIYCDLGSYRGADYLELDLDGNLYLTTFYSNALLKIKPDKSIEKIEIEGARLVAPTGIAFGNGGFEKQSLYIANYKGRSVVKVNIGIGAAKR